MQKHPQLGPRFIRTKPAALYLGISQHKLRAFIHDGQIPVVQHTERGPFLLDIKDLEKFAETRKEVL